MEGRDFGEEVIKRRALGFLSWVVLVSFFCFTGAVPAFQAASESHSYHISIRHGIEDSKDNNRQHARRTDYRSRPPQRHCHEPPRDGPRDVSQPGRSQILEVDQTDRHMQIRREVVFGWVHSAQRCLLHITRHILRCWLLLHGCFWVLPGMLTFYCTMTYEVILTKTIGGTNMQRRRWDLRSGGSDVQ